MHNTKPRSGTADTKLSSKNTRCSAKLTIRLQKSDFCHKGAQESSSAYKRHSQYVLQIVTLICIVPPYTLTEGTSHSSNVVFSYTLYYAAVCMCCINFCCNNQCGYVGLSRGKWGCTVRECCKMLHALAYLSVQVKKQSHA